MNQTPNNHTIEPVEPDESVVATTSGGFPAPFSCYLNKNDRRRLSKAAELAQQGMSEFASQAIRDRTESVLNRHGVTTLPADFESAACVETEAKGWGGPFKRVHAVRAGTKQRPICGSRAKVTRVSPTAETVTCGHCIKRLQRSV